MWDNAKAELGLADIVAATDATVNLYSDSTFTTEVTGANTIALAAGGNTVAYIKVTAEDGTTELFYAVTITRAAAPVPATGITASVAAKGTPEDGKVMLTISTEVTAGGLHEIYYRIVDTDPAALNVGDEITTGEWTENTDGTAAFEISAVDGKFVEVVEITTADSKVTKWGKTGATDDGIA